MAIPATPALRRGVLAVCVLHDVDLVPTPAGVELGGPTPVGVSWAECARALRGADPDGDEGRHLLAAWLRARRLIADHTSAGLAEQVRPLGLPVGHVFHPGPGWAHRRVLGGAAELGLGLIGLDPRQREREVTAVAPGVWAAAGIDRAGLWPAAAAYLSRMSRLAVERRLRCPSEPLRPMGDCDVVTLLCHRGLRVALCNPTGMVAAGVPMRSRGWTELRQVDPAFIVAAAAATDPPQRGFPRPLLITADEIVMVAAGGRPGTLPALDAVAESPWLRPVRYR
ncbi:MAG: hypothetical protein ABJA34_08745 [Pseudonocardiales bacterium]